MYVYTLNVCVVCIPYSRHFFNQRKQQKLLGYATLSSNKFTLINNNLATHYHSGNPIV